MMPELTTIPDESNVAATVMFDAAVHDTYAGLRRMGYTRLSAIRTLRTVGVSFGDAKRASDRYEPNSPLFGGS